MPTVFPARSAPAEAVVFDLDGTLLDSLGDIADAMNAVLSGLGLPTHPRDRYRIFVGDGLEALVRRALPRDARGEAVVAQALVRMRDEYGRRATATTRPYPEVPELLDGLAGCGVPFAVLTNKPHEAAVDMVDRLLGRWRFAAVLGPGPETPRKPDPAGALRVAGSMGVPPEACLYVGDTAVDMATARAAGMIPAGALWGFRTEDELVAAGARHLLASPLAALPLVQGA